MEALSQLIRKLRGKESLREASKRIGISHTYLDTIEKGFDKRSGKQVKPTPETLRLISNAYKYDYEELMREAGYLEDIEESKNDINVAGKEIKLSSEEIEVFKELRKHPNLFHDLASNPEKKVKELIKLYTMKKMFLEDDDEEPGDGFGSLKE
ncbi:helix-turn-helix domain-containing protein [Psychrobacillus vulpis]|uniref:Helix-turn-helix transcriptional regulator n=1 Tax=Psychrobacillus vulpis TaxID=2325572 RepID=A0A544TWM2_9BACI|nr:helix-turn-helix transcriptional regulator [Psychrobacillus vulpis]TQR21830.1 helix-turn-helix transcriptional regulator [Psychrobacillus vulpis]